MGEVPEYRTINATFPERAQEAQPLPAPEPSPTPSDATAPDDPTPQPARSTTHEQRPQRECHHAEHGRNGRSDYDYHPPIGHATAHTGWYGNEAKADRKPPVQRSVQRPQPAPWTGTSHRESDRKSVV